jgi:S1-C subfamily serine protease
MVSSGALAFAQTSPEAKRSAAEKERAMVFSRTFAGGGYLGVQTKDVSKENMAQFGLSEVRGVAVEKVLENSPAANAGIMPGDVIVRFNGEEVTSVRKLTRLIGEVAPDHKAKIDVLRNGAKRDFDVTLGKRETPQLFNGSFNLENFPSVPGVSVLPRGEFPVMKNFPPLIDGGGDNPRGFVFTTGASRQIGINVTSLTKQLGDYFGAAEGKGLLINSVREDSPAAKAGLRAGDIIVEAEGKEIKNNVDLIRIINEKKEGDVNLTIIRDRNRQTLTVTPEASKGGEFRIDGFPEKFLEQNPAMKLQKISPPPRMMPLDLETIYAPKILE